MELFQNFQLAEVGAIVVIVYLIAQGIKCTSIDSKWIPVICGAAGAILGLIAFFIGVSNFPGENALDSIAVGIVSGFAATGINQVYKQLTKD